jgi:hypothetical protein
VFLFWGARAPLWTIAAAYAPPPVLSEDALPGQLKRLDAAMGDAATLIGYWAAPETVHPGGEVAVTLCWRPMRQTDVNYSVYVHLLGRGQKIVGQRDTYPGGGSLATSAWEPGASFCDTLRIPIAQDAERSTVLRLTAGLYDAGTGARLPVFDGLGHPTTIMEDAARLDGGAMVPSGHTASAVIGSEIELAGWDAEFQPDDSSQARVTLHWRAVAAPSGDYTVFVHLLDAEGVIAAQHDGVPADGYYPTRWWVPGEVVEDAHLLKADSPIPPGPYMIKVGMYRTDHPEQRLSVTVNGADVPEKRVLLGPITR